MESERSIDESWEKLFDRVGEQFNKHREITERLLKVVGEIEYTAIMAPPSPEMEAIQKLIKDTLDSFRG